MCKLIVTRFLKHFVFYEQKDYRASAEAYCCRTNPASPQYVRILNYLSYIPCCGACKISLINSMCGLPI